MAKGWIARIGCIVLCALAVGCTPSTATIRSTASPKTATIASSHSETDVPSPTESALRRRIQERPDDAGAQLKLIGYLLADHRGHDGLEAARAALKWLPKNQDLLAALGDAEAAVGDYAAATVRLRGLAPKSSRFRLKFAEALLLGGRRKEALDELNQIRRQPNLDRAALVRMYAAALEPDLALSVLQRGEKPSSYEALALVGTLNLATGRYETAADAFQRALLVRPGDPTLSFYRGVSLRLGGKAGDRKDSVAALDSACARMPEGRMFQYELALARRAAGDWSGALEAIRRAGEISPNAAEVFRDQAELLERAGDKTGATLSGAAAYRKLADPDGALKALRPLIGEKPDPSALAAAADAFNEKGDGAAARRQLDRLPPIDTLPAGALWETYRSCRAIARNKEALAALEQLRKLSPDEVRVRDEHADTLQTLGKYAESEVILRELKRLEPQNPYRPYQLGMHLVLWSHQPDAKVEAEKEYREAIRISPGFAGPRYRLGMLLLETKRPRPAIVQFRRALGISPRFSDALRGLARAYDAAGEKTLAEEAFRLQRLAAQRDALIERLKRRDKHQRVSVQNRRALVRVYLEGNEPDLALGQLEVIGHLGVSTADERQLLMRLYGLQRRYQRQDELRRSMSARR